MADQSNAGPFHVGVDGSLAPDESAVIELSEVEAGPAQKKGYLRKIFGGVGGMDYIYIVNASAELVTVESAGSASVVPNATSQNLDSGPYRRVTITNKGANTINTSDSDQVAVEVGNGPRTGSEGESFSVRKAINDSIPGASF